MGKYVRAVALSLLLPKELEKQEIIPFDAVFLVQSMKCFMSRSWTVEVEKFVIMIGHEVHFGLGEGHENSS
jgi:hypothetical protein